MSFSHSWPCIRPERPHRTSSSTRRCRTLAGELVRPRLGAARSAAGNASTVSETHTGHRANTLRSDVLWEPAERGLYAGAHGLDLAATAIPTVKRAGTSGRARGKAERAVHWSIVDVARMSGVTARTLRHYDDI